MLNKSRNKTRNTDIGVLASFNGLGNIKPFRICLEGVEYNINEIISKKDNNYAASQSVSFICKLEDGQLKEIIYFVSSHCWKCRNINSDSFNDPVM